jgi:hypothetical protein
MRIVFADSRGTLIRFCFRKPLSQKHARGRIDREIGNEYHSLRSPHKNLGTGERKVRAKKTNTLRHDRVHVFSISKLRFLTDDSFLFQEKIRNKENEYF